MKRLPEAFEAHERWAPTPERGQQILDRLDREIPLGDCLICALWDEPAWFWHDDVAPPGGLREALAKVREALRLLGLEILLALAKRLSP